MKNIKHETVDTVREKERKLHSSKIKNKGITLIALVITIVILIILAGISIMALTQTGLFDKVNQAKQKSENAQKEENSILGDYANEIDKYIVTSQRDGNAKFVELYDNNNGETSGNLNQSIKNFDVIMVIYGSPIDTKIYDSTIINPKYPCAAFNFAAGGTTIYGTISLNDTKFSIDVLNSKDSDWNIRYKIYNITGIKF